MSQTNFDDYYKVGIGDIAAGAAVAKSEDGHYYSGLVLNPPTTEQLERSVTETPGEPAYRLSIEDNGVDGDGAALTLSLSHSRSGDDNIVMVLELPDSSLRLLHSAIGAVLSMREAQAACQD